MPHVDGQAGILKADGQIDKVVVKVTAAGEPSTAPVCSLPGSVCARLRGRTQTASRCCSSTRKGWSPYRVDDQHEETDVRAEADRRRRRISAAVVLTVSQGSALRDACAYQARDCCRRASRCISRSLRCRAVARFPPSLRSRECQCSARVAQTVAVDVAQVPLLAGWDSLVTPKPEESAIRPSCRYRAIRG